LVGWCEQYPDAAGAEFTEAGLLELKGSAILHFLNKFPIDWYSKKQATVKTATYGSEYISARTCVDQIVDLQTTLRYLGIPIRDVSYIREPKIAE
jgi:hypothetical protein